MSENEMYYANKYEHPGFELSKHCSGTGCCSTCMYRKVEQNFENDYCLDAKKEGNNNGN